MWKKKRKVRDGVAGRRHVTPEESSLLFIRMCFPPSHYEYSEKTVADVTHILLELGKILVPAVLFHHVLHTFLWICQF